MTMTFDMLRIIAPVWRICALGACAAIATMAPVLSDRLGIQGNTGASVRRAPLAATSPVSIEKREQHSTKISDRINAIWGTDKNQVFPAKPPEAVRPEHRPVMAIMIAGHL